MDYRTLGKTGIKVSDIGFGAWQLGDYGSWNGPDEKQSIRMIHEALEKGCNFFDTAPPYGEGRSEEAIGEALKGGKRTEAVICTKYGYSPKYDCDFTPAGLRKSVEDSLRRLQTDYVDCLLIHNPPFELLNGNAPQWETFAQLKKEGKIRSYGASVDNPEDIKEVLNTTDSEVIEIFFNMIHQQNREILPLIREKNIGTIIKVPLDSGWLTGKYNRNSTFDGVRNRWSKEQIEERGDFVDKLSNLLPENMKILEGAFRYLLSYPEIGSIIAGVKSIEQLISNCSYSGGDLPKTVLKEIENFFDQEIRPRKLSW